MGLRPVLDPRHLRPYNPPDRPRQKDFRTASPQRSKSFFSLRPSLLLLRPLSQAAPAAAVPTDPGGRQQVAGRPGDQAGVQGKE